MHDGGSLRRWLGRRAAARGGPAVHRRAWCRSTWWVRTGTLTQVVEVDQASEALPAGIRRAKGR
jgi:hypothetical protein